ncbi:Polymerase/histidinol phosphatase-like protein [Gorgonomyces haynaldii]|nr:Polymerase/histidinol phosphatase-like protein [Gorgonomyces haynaldii]
MDVEAQRQKRQRTVYLFIETLCILFLYQLVTLLLSLIPKSEQGPISNALYSTSTFNYTLNASRLQPIDNFTISPQTVFLDAHVHSTVSDGALDPHQVIDWLIASGYSAVFVSDHQTLDGYHKFKQVLGNRSLILLPAVEWTTCRLHMNLLNLKQMFPLCGIVDGKAVDKCPFPSDDLIRYVIEQTHLQGGLVMVNHIPWSKQAFPGRNEPTSPDMPSLDQLVAWGVDAIEIANGQTFDLQSFLYARKRGLIPLTGSDMHTPSPPYAWTMLNPSELTPDGVWKEIVEKRTSLVYDARGLDFYPPQESLPRKDQIFDNWLQLSTWMDTFARSENGQYSGQQSFCHPKLYLWFPAALFLFLGYMILMAILLTLLRLLPSLKIRKKKE